MRIFYNYGLFCATHPWEVILTILTLTLCMLTVEQHEPPKLYSESDNNAVDLIAMTVIRCVAILYSYYQFRKLQEHNSKYILGAAALFTGFSSFMFTSTVLNVIRIDTSELKDALFFFLISIDLIKAAVLAGFALRTAKQEEIKTNIAVGLSVLGPHVTLDTLVETLLIGVGSLSGVQRLEKLSCFVCLALVINYIVFMTFYPAFLSLIMELSRHYKNVNLAICKDAEKTPNPVVQRVKLIMSFGLIIVHVLSRCSDDSKHMEQTVKFNKTEESVVQGYVMKWVTLSADHIVILILLIALVVKYTYFENSEWTFRHVSREHRSMQTDDLISRKIALSESTEVFDEQDDEIVELVNKGEIKISRIESAVSDYQRGVKIRRKVLMNRNSCDLSDLPYLNYEYDRIMGSCCENVIGYMPVPLGVAGPLNLDDRMFYVPMATTEGCLIASTNRGCRALLELGVKSQIISDGMSRGPAIRFPSVQRASEILKWLDCPQNFQDIKAVFDSTSRYARLKRLKSMLYGRLMFVRFVAQTGDAMGMNMVSKGAEAVLKYMKRLFADMEIVTLSGNYCTDKKAAAINWIEGRGKYVICEAIIPTGAIKNVLKTNVNALIDLNQSKNLTGSAAAGCLGGGCNAHAANIVTAIFIATGQDPAQNVTSSNCMTLMESCEDGLYMTCTMPSLEVGTIGGGTNLSAQGSCLQMLGVRGANIKSPGENAAQLARIVCGTVLAGELSLLAALATGDLVKSHLKHNRSTTSQDQCDSSPSTNLA